jgi:hypothetical protein
VALQRSRWDAGRRIPSRGEGRRCRRVRASRVGVHDCLDVEEGAHRPVQLDVLVERHEVARDAAAPGVGLDQDDLRAEAVPAEVMDGHPIGNPHVAVDELEPVAHVEQVEGKLEVVVLGPLRGWMASGSSSFWTMNLALWNFVLFGCGRSDSRC